MEPELGVAGVDELLRDVEGVEGVGVGGVAELVEEGGDLVVGGGGLGDEGEGVGGLVEEVEGWWWGGGAGGVVGGVGGGGLRFGVGVELQPEVNAKVRWSREARGIG